MNRICQNCKKEFVFTPEDLDFFARLKVPPPTFCPECRMQRRMLWRCERSLYRRTCDLCKKNIISAYSTEKPHTVYCRECFHGDTWDPFSYGRDYDFSKPFFQQLKELQRDVPRQFAFAFQNVNSDYTNGAAFNKNCYLIFVSDHNEDSQFSYSILYCHNSSDLLNSTECEFCYECVTCKKCYQVSFSEDCTNSQNLVFCKNCNSCQDCVGSVNLKNKRYCIFNVQYSKEEYEKRLKDMNLNTRAGLDRLRGEVHTFWNKFPVKYIHGFQNTNVAGDYLFNSKNADHCFDSELLEDCKYLNHANKSKSVYDAYVCVDNTEYSYEFVGGLGARNVRCSLWPFTDFDSDYADSCENSNNLFGCVSLRKQQYCILNKQYSKEEYEVLREKIINHMNEMPYVDLQGRVYKYGEFFPIDLCPFSYNESVVQEYFPLTRDVAVNQGYTWKDPEERDYAITLKAEAIPDTIDGVSNTILAEVIGCAHGGTCNDGCTMAFRLHNQELEFYRKIGVPIPKLCFNCRHFGRLGRKNPITLYERACQCSGSVSENGAYTNTERHFHEGVHCPNTFRTTYAADRSEIVYCEPCFQAETA